MNNRHQDRTADWFDFTSFQEWSRTAHIHALRAARTRPASVESFRRPTKNTATRITTGLGAEAGRGFGGRPATKRVGHRDGRGYQTAGETARRRTNVLTDTGGGWMNGRGDDAMTMFLVFCDMVDFFTSFEWWKTTHDEVVSHGKNSLARPGMTYVYTCPEAGRQPFNSGWASTVERSSMR